MYEERRTRRSERLETALGYQLQSSAERAELDAMILADQDGLVVAASPWGAGRSEEVAALLPLMLRGTETAMVFLGEEAEEELLVNCFEAAGTQLFLCAVGNSCIQTAGELRRVQEGVRRILN
jgi:predicted regulator of Ras-like GTPase activity (Roadblock/LC7/MglB family)